MSKLNLMVLYGGPSTEHEVSLRSAKSIINHLNKDKYNVIPVGVDKETRWFLQDLNQQLNNGTDSCTIGNSIGEIVLNRSNNQTLICNKQDLTEINHVDVVLPIIHGAYGEDGILQGILTSYYLPYVGPDILGSSCAMDKDVAKRLFEHCGIPTAKGIVLRKNADPIPSYTEVKEKLGEILFVKPANAGSSVGVSKVTDEISFTKALNEAFEFDRKILIEENIVGREIECAVLGNEFPKASTLGQIVATKDFYSYDAKYIDQDGAKMQIPAAIEEDIAEKIKQSAIKGFQALALEGIARVDFFLKNDNTFVINEINTLPGFTSISMYPKMWEASGLPFNELLDSMIELALERDAQLKILKKSPK